MPRILTVLLLAALLPAEEGFGPLHFSRVIAGPANMDGDEVHAIRVDGWWLLGPLESRSTDQVSLLPLVENDLPDLAALWPGADGAVLAWSWRQHRGARVEPASCPRDRTWYAWTEVVAPRAGNYWVALGADDWGRFKVNSVVQWESGRDTRPFRPDEWVSEIPLVEGRNELLLRFENQGGTTGFAVTFLLGDEEPVPAWVPRDPRPLRWQGDDAAIAISDEVAKRCHVILDTHSPLADAPDLVVHGAALVSGRVRTVEADGPGCLLTTVAPRHQKSGRLQPGVETIGLPTLLAQLRGKAAVQGTVRLELEGRPTEAMLVALVDHLVLYGAGAVEVKFLDHAEPGLVTGSGFALTDSGPNRIAEELSNLVQLGAAARQAVLARYAALGRRQADLAAALTAQMEEARQAIVIAPDIEGEVARNLAHAVQVLRLLAHDLRYERLARLGWSGEATADSLRAALPPIPPAWPLGEGFAPTAPLGQRALAAALATCVARARNIVDEMTMLME